MDKQRSKIVLPARMTFSKKPQVVEKENFRDKFGASEIEFATNY